MSSDATNKDSKNSKKVADEKSPTKTETSSDNSSSTSTKTSKSSVPARSTSYFSSVSTDEYRSGWDAVFNGTSLKKNKDGKGRERNATLDLPLDLPLSIMLSNEDLSKELNELLKKAVRKRAKKDKLPIGRLLTRAQIKWNLECKIGE